MHKLLISLILFNSINLLAATVRFSASAEVADVQAQHTAASNGDIIYVPPSSVVDGVPWSNYIAVTKAVTIMGAGRRGDLTIIKDYSTNAKVIVSVNPVANQVSRFSSFVFTNGNRTAANDAFNGSVVLGRTSGNPLDGHFLRMDNCTWKNIIGLQISSANMIGLVDHCKFEMPTAKKEETIYFYQTYWKGGTYGDGSWADTIDHNGTNFVFVENIGVNFTAPTPIFGSLDGQFGMRGVLRYSDLTNANVSSHGTENENRGSRVLQVYKNNFYSNALPANINPSDGPGGACRSGCYIFASNNIYGSWPTNARMGTIAAYRLYSPGPGTFAGADGTNIWDKVVNTNAVITGTHNGANNASVLTDTTQSWTNNQMINFYTVQNKTKSQANNYGLISANTATTISFYPPFNGLSVKWDTGDTYKIYQIPRYVLDQPGSPGGDPLTNGRPPSVIGWPNQTNYPSTTEICRAWENIHINSGLKLRMEGATTCYEGESFTNEVALPGWTPIAYPHPAIAGTKILPAVVDTPSPADAATGIDPGSVTLSWSLKAFDHDIYFGTVNPPTSVISTERLTNNLALAPLANGTTYYWRVVAFNIDGTSTNTFSFTTSGTTTINPKLHTARKRRS